MKLFPLLNALRLWLKSKLDASFWWNEMTKEESSLARSSLTSVLMRGFYANTLNLMSHIRMVLLSVQTEILMLPPLLCLCRLNFQLHSGLWLLLHMCTPETEVLLLPSMEKHRTSIGRRKSLMSHILGCLVALPMS